MNSPGKPKILILGSFTFSRGEAGSNYVIGLGKAMVEAGFCVEYLAENREQTAARDDFQGFTCHTTLPGQTRPGWKAAVRNICGSENSLLKWLERRRAGEYHAIVAYPGGDFTSAVLSKLHAICRARDWELAVVVGEWQGFRQLNDSKLRHRVLATVDSEIQRRFVNKKVKNIIAISRYLHRYYQDSGCNAMLVPPMIDTLSEKWQCRPTAEGHKRGVRLIFSGAWWRDRLDLIFEAIVKLRCEGQDVVMEFLGSGVEDLGRNQRLRKQLMEAPEGTFRFHGKVPVEKVLPITASADFGVLLRDRAKWSDACFPSKVVEFQALGVPLLCNLTSNLGEHLVDGVNALVVPRVSLAAFEETVRRAVALSPKERECMKRRSLECAANHFDFRNFSDSLGRFIRPIPKPTSLNR